MKGNKLRTRNVVLRECCVDYVGLWSILREIEGDNPNINSFEARRETLELIKELMHDELIQPGMFAEDTNFELWKLSPQDTISCIEVQWDILGRKPTIGEIVWFIITEKGERHIEEQM